MGKPLANWPFSASPASQPASHRFQPLNQPDTSEFCSEMNPWDAAYPQDARFRGGLCFCFVSRMLANRFGTKAERAQCAGREWKVRRGNVNKKRSASVRLFGMLHLISHRLHIGALQESEIRVREPQKRGLLMRLLTFVLARGVESGASRVTYTPINVYIYIYTVDILWA